ncbi:MAG: P-loop NTPase fold protein [Sphingorhabdus sp.]
MSEFSDDAPKKNPWQDDLLGYYAFADRLSTALIGMSAPNGYVVGLHGPWGSGKSTVLNFVEACFEKHVEEGTEQYLGITLLRFEPWIVSGYQDLSSAFFKLLSEQIADGTTNRERWWKRTSRALEVGANPVIDAAATLGAIIDHTGGIASRASGSVAKKSVKIAVDKWLSEPSLQSTYEKLVERLSSQKRKYIILIDDIDRLTAEEIRSIMQMVKTVGKLPNVIYLLAYDREIVWSALGTERTTGGKPAFAEKIIQHEVELPKPPKHLLLHMLNTATSFLPDASPDSLRWTEIVHAGILRWVKSPRDVVRFANALTFAWPALEGEIDAQDLYCMEGLRLFERPVYEWIRRNRDLLLGEGRARLYLAASEEEGGAQFRSALPVETKEEIIALLCALFPNKKKFFRGNDGGISNEMWFQVVQRRGIATKPGFDSYFSLAPIPTAIPKALIDFAMSNLNDQAVQLDCIEAAIEKEDEYGNTLVGEYFQELQYRFTRSSLCGSQDLLNTLVNSHDKIAEIKWAGDIFSPFSNLHFLIVELLKKWEPDEAATAVEIAIAQSTSIAASASIVADRARELGVLPSGGGSSEQLIPLSRLEVIAKDLVDRFISNAGTAELDEAAFYYDIARLWAKFGDPLAAREWLSNVSRSSPNRLARIAKGLLTYSRSSVGRSYGLREQPDQTLYDIDVLYEAAESFLDSQSLSEDEKAQIIALKRGIDEMRQRKAEQDQEVSEQS